MIHRPTLPRDPPAPWGRRLSAALTGALVAAGLAALAASGGCSFHYAQGQALEAQERWEEAAIEYRLAFVEDPDDPDYRDALERMNKVVARENYERYQEYLAGKEFRKAYHRLSDASSQDPSFEPVREEQEKWVRVLLSGRVLLSFESLRTNLSLADEIRLFARFNTPNPGQTVEGEIDIDTGIFFVEDLLYEPPDRLLAYYTLNSIGVSLVQGRSSRRQFTSTQVIRLVNFRTPVLEAFEGELDFGDEGEPKPIQSHREGLPATEAKRFAGREHWYPPVNLRYSITAEGERVVVDTRQGRSEFLPRFLYLNREARRLFVGFGHYEILQHPDTRRWGVTRLALDESDYFRRLSRNIALQPYFFYHGHVLEFVERERG